MMNWKQLLSTARRGDYQKVKVRGGSDLRTEFEKDYHRIIGSASFRRLQDKTQVFPWDKSDFIRTRLTHSLEVSSLAKSLGQNIAESILQKNLDPAFTEKTKSDICDILLSAGLIHDIGNPPFGHFGEDAIRDWFSKNLSRLKFKGIPLTEILSEQMQEDFYQFEGNAQALRLVTKLYYLVNETGLDLTYGLLNTIIKYPVNSLQRNPRSSNIAKRKMGYFFAEEDLFHRITEECGTYDCRHPLTFILEAADDIAYRTADIEDAAKKGFVPYDLLLSELHRYLDPVFKEKENICTALLENQYKKALNRHEHDPKMYAVSNFVVGIQGYLIYYATQGFTRHYYEIMEGTYQQDLFYGTPGKAICDTLGKIAYRYAFMSHPIMKLEIAAGKILDYLLDTFMEAFLHYDTGTRPGVMEEKAQVLVSEYYKHIYHYYAEGKSEQMRLYLRMLLVTDYISGMTDTFAKDLYQELNGIV